MASESWQGNLLKSTVQATRGFVLAGIIAHACVVATWATPTSAEILPGPYGVEEQTQRSFYFESLPSDCALDAQTRVVVYHSTDGVYAVRLDADWMPIEEPIQVNEQTGSYFETAVACDNRGGFVVAWNSDQQPCLQVRAYGAYAEPLSDPRRLTRLRQCASRSERLFQLDIGEDGQYRALWVTRSLESTDASVVFRLRMLGDDGAHPQKPIVLKRSVDRGYISNREEAVRANGEAALVVQMSAHAVVGQVFALDGAARTDSFRINSQKHSGPASVLAIEDLGDGTMIPWWSSLWQTGSIGRRINLSAKIPPATTTTTLPAPEGNEPVFAQPSRLTRKERDAVGASVASSTNGTAVVVSLSTDSSSYDQQISVARNSVSDGWSESRVLAAGNESTGRPSIATDSDGAWIAVWRQANESGCDLVASRSDDDGRTWSAVETIVVDAPVNSPRVSCDAEPRLAADGDAWIAMWIERPLQPSTYHALLRMSRSVDRGRTWSNASTIYGAADTSTIYDFDFEAVGNGHWLAAWPIQSWTSSGSGYSSRSSVFVSRSIDRGGSWSTPEAIASEEGKNGLAPYYLGVVLAADLRGKVLLATGLMQYSLDGNSDGDGDLVLIRSSDEGRSWSSPRSILPYADSDVANDGEPSLATDREGHWLLSWITSQKLPRSDGLDDDVAVAQSTDNGASWTRPEGLHARFETDRRSDRRVEVVSRGAGNWLAVWLGYNPFPNYDDAVFAATGMSPQGSATNVP